MSKKVFLILLITLLACFLLNGCMHSTDSTVSESVEEISSTNSSYNEQSSEIEEEMLTYSSLTEDEKGYYKLIERTYNRLNDPSSLKIYNLCYAYLDANEKTYMIEFTAANRMGGSVKGHSTANEICADGWDSISVYSTDEKTDLSRILTALRNDGFLIQTE